MVIVTDTAASKLRDLLREQGTPEHGLRMGATSGGCSGVQYRLAFEPAAAEGDEVLEANGIRLFLDTESSELLGGATLDYEDGLMGAGFRIDNPNVASSGCACGGSCSC